MWEKTNTNKPILDYLEKHHTQELIKAKDDEEKSAIGLMEYILSKAKAEINGNAGMIENDVVFGWAVHYIIESEDILKKENLTKVNLDQAKINKIETKEKEASKPKEIKKDENQVTLFDLL